MSTNNHFPTERDEHPFAPFVRILGKGKRGSRSLTESEAFEAMSMILDGQVLDLQLGAFLMLLRIKEESPEEIAGFARACRAHLTPPADLTADLDWSSYAGKRRHLPWFLLAAHLLGRNGVRVFMHGAGGHTQGRVYTESVARHLGLSVASNWNSAHTALETDGFCYMPLSALNQRLHDIIQMRSILGLRSPVHSLVRLLNPLSAQVVLQGIFHPSYSEIHQRAASLLGYANVTVIKGEGGEIERNPDARLLARTVVQGQLNEEEWPPLSELRHLKPETLSLDHLTAVWKGEASDSYGERAVIGTLAIALKALGRADTQEGALHLARTMWDQRSTGA